MKKDKKDINNLLKQSDISIPLKSTKTNEVKDAKKKVRERDVYNPFDKYCIPPENSKFKDFINFE